MILPPFLESPPPRDITPPIPIFAKNYTIIRWLTYIAIAFFCITIIFMSAFHFEFIAISLFGIMFGILALVFYLNTKKMLPLYQYGTATIGTIKKIEYETTSFSGTGAGGITGSGTTTEPGTIYIEFYNRQGKLLHGTLTGFIGKGDTRFPTEGEEVAVLYDHTNGTSLLAMHAPKFGMISGRVEEKR